MEVAREEGMDATPAGSSFLSSVFFLGLLPFPCSPAHPPAHPTPPTGHERGVIARRLAALAPRRFGVGLATRVTVPVPCRSGAHTREALARGSPESSVSAAAALDRGEGGGDR